MYTQEIRWYALVPVSILLGFAVLCTELSGVWGTIPVRPDWFFCLAVCASLRSPPVSSLAAFAWCGLVRDLMLGPKPGAAMLAYVAVGWIAVFWKPLAADHGLPGQALLAGAGTFFASFAKHTLDSGRLAHKLWDGMLVIAAGDALLTCIASIPAFLVLWLPSFRPWKERGGYYRL